MRTHFTDKGVEHAEMVEAQLDAFIEKRQREAADEQRVEELWAESARRERKKRRRENGMAWIAFHERMGRLFLELAREHHARSEKVLRAVERLEEDG